MVRIKEVFAREVLDSRGNPTIEVDVTTDAGVMGRAIVPSGASTGEREALELRDLDKNRYMGKGVLKAVENVNTVLGNIVKGMDVTNQYGVDSCLIEADGTSDKSKYGANAILGISLAVAVAASKSEKKSLFRYLNDSNEFIMPVPMMNVLNGGSHADSSIDFQEYMIMPVSALSIHEAIRMGSEVFHTLKKILKENHQITSVGDEGGFAPNLKDNEEPLKYIVEAIKASGYEPEKDFLIALDVAASEFYNGETKKYDLKKSGSGSKTSEEMILWYEELCNKYPIISIEDGMDQNDWDGWKKLTEKMKEKVQIVGDDLFVTNPSLLKKGIDLGIANSILIKVNQIGTLTETFDAIHMAKENGYTAIISHRSGETEDTSIADIAVAFGTGQIKTGSLSRTDRIAKYNQLMRIEEELAGMSIYPQKNTFQHLK